MKNITLALCGVALLLGSCNQTAPVESTPTAAAPSAPAAPAAVPPATLSTPPVNDTATAPAPAVAPSKLKEAETLKLSFAFKPAPNPDDPEHPKTSAFLKVQGSQPQEIDLGKFASKPDIVDADKAKLAGFPSGMLLGFRSYQASSGTSSDLAVLNVGGRRLRIVQRRVEETASEPGVFETSREIPLPPNTIVAPAKK
ncbi:MAG TPA: hypothetical protein VF629_22195 [Hymenobacter sp.]|jgi:3-oxoacyl-ACP reductase-like protein|uniref:hypothetical protein n=1 Tax=Hymenobacter sp. TaxID=1898978 RepID=UPI002EDB3B19